VSRVWADVDGAHSQSRGSPATVKRRGPEILDPQVGPRTHANHGGLVIVSSGLEQTWRRSSSPRRTKFSVRLCESATLLSLSCPPICSRGTAGLVTKVCSKGTMPLLSFDLEFHRRGLVGENDVKRRIVLLKVSIQRPASTPSCFPASVASGSTR